MNVVKGFRNRILEFYIVNNNGGIGLFLRPVRTFICNNDQKLTNYQAATLMNLISSHN